MVRWKHLYYSSLIDMIESWWKDTFYKCITFFFPPTLYNVPYNVLWTVLYTLWHKAITYYAAYCLCVEGFIWLNSQHVMWQRDKYALYYNNIKVPANYIILIVWTPKLCLIKDLINIMWNNIIKNWNLTKYCLTNLIDFHYANQRVLS